MANSFSKEERVAFEDILEGFNDALVLSKNVSMYRTDGTMMERTNNVIWRPQPYIAQSFDGTDQSLNFTDFTQLTVPATLGFSKSVPWTMTSLEMRDALQEGRLGDAAKQKLASDINLAIMNVAALQGSLVVRTFAAAGDYDDVALCDTIMNEQGVQQFDRYLALSSRDYNGMAGNLAVATRSFGNKVSDDAYRKGFVGDVAGFMTYKFDYANRIRAASGSDPTIDTRASAANYWVPVATTVASTGESSNVDNRFQTITHSAVTTELAAGDAITISGVNAVHHITKADTGELKTFRIVQRLTSTTSVITPPIISAQGGSDAELQYQNCVVTPASGATISRLNNTAAPINCFWQKDALEILPGRYAVPTDAGAAVMRASTDQGIELVMQKQYDINTMKTKYRLDTLFGVVNKQPEMSGILIFGQTAP
jgi:hypothetical protein